MKIAQKIKKKIIKKYKGQILGIAIYGSVAKNEDRKYSDIEMFVITKKRIKTSDLRYLYKGIPIEVSYISERKMLYGAKQITPNWPIVTDFYRSYLVLYEMNEWFKRLQKAVASQNPKEFERAIEKTLIWLYELIGKIKNAYLYKKNNLFFYLVSHFGWESIILLGLINRRYFKSERCLFETVFEFPILPKNCRHLLKTVCHFSVKDRKKIYLATIKLFNGLLKLAQKQGIVLKQQRLLV
jgi:kanamycin nucleotidyltransferase